MNLEHKRRNKNITRGTNFSFSLSNKLKKESKSSDEFEFMVSRLSLEELIGLKLELSAKLLGGKLYGFNLWSSFPKIAKEGLFLYALSATSTIADAASLLGLGTNKFFIIKKYYERNKYFKVLDTFEEK